MAKADASEMPVCLRASGSTVRDSNERKPNSEERGGRPSLFSISEDLSLSSLALCV
jgi:hypothetical protein